MKFNLFAITALALSLSGQSSHASDDELDLAIAWSLQESYQVHHNDADYALAFSLQEDYAPANNNRQHEADLASQRLARQLLEEEKSAQEVRRIQQEERDHQASIIFARKMEEADRQLAEMLQREADDIARREVEVQQSPLPEPLTVQTSDLENGILQAANLQRQNNGLGTLVFHDKLMSMARAHSANMAAASALQHSLNGSTLVTRANGVQYNYTVIAENIACDSRLTGNVAQTVMDMWMISQGHRANILTAAYNEAGVGIVQAANGMLYFTMVYGKR